MRPEIVVVTSLVGLSLLSMAAYRFSAAGRARGRDATGRGGSFVLGFFVRDWFYWALRPVRWAAFASGASPFVFNLLGLAGGIASGVAFGLGHLPVGGALILLSGIADVLDGDVARRRGLVSDAGAFIDSTLDRFAELAVFVGLVVFYGSGPGVVLAVIALGGSLMVSYARARGESLGVLCKLGVLQRAERMLLLGLGPVLDPTLSHLLLGRDTGALTVGVLAVLAVGTTGTAVFRTVWIARRLGERG
ncbi:MAG TPA: CDP-alcohol phosphatidyltransferase family protein [Candidatus Krumholzibacteria bacterium]|nr:CDP-alcohol phosphatidyltransferase family protein [Candidatus Krumholzibacteria bacterium]